MVLIPDVPALALRGVALAPGDQIAAFALDGTCVGMTEWTGGATALTVWADDPMTPDLDGLQAGEPIALAVWDRSEDMVLEGGEVTPTFDPAFAPDQGFVPDGLYLLATATTSPDDSEHAPPAATLGDPFPNPTAGRARLPLALPAEAVVTVEVFDALGRRVATPLDGAALPPGAHDLPLDGAGLASGVYVVRVRVDEAVLQARLSISR